MRAETLTVTVPTDHQTLFDFLANPENLPTWAPRFASSIRRDGEGWLVQTPQGEVPLRYVTDASLGVIDAYLSPAPGVEALAPSRVIPTGAAAAYLFTLIPAPGMPDEVFDAQRATLAADLGTLQQLFAA